MLRITRTDDHEDEIRGLDSICFSPLEAHPLEIPAEADVWVALDGDNVVGYLVATHEEELPGACWRHYLDRYGVHPDHAGRGIGKRLVRAWLRHTATRPGWIWTYTHSHNAPSINALISSGFRAWRAPMVPDLGVPPLPRFCMWRRETP